MSAAELKDALEKCVTTLSNPFLVYKDFARQFGFSEKYPPAWANRTTLDPAADLLKADPLVGLDLTYLIRSQETGYPSIIDGQPFDPKNDGQKRRARAVADQIIKKYKLNAANPY